MSDVDAGGYTVFTEIGLKVPPVKGGAAFWWNLKKNGSGDFNTRHAGCPVLAGSKWGKFPTLSKKLVCLQFTPSIWRQ